MRRRLQTFRARECCEIVRSPTKWPGSRCQIKQMKRPRLPRGGSRTAARLGTGRCFPIAELLAVRKRDRHELAAMAAVTQRVGGHVDLHSRREGLGNPAL